jgi:NodT family efflux transporter outer membrane factor (OMF) lipoprotein
MKARPILSVSLTCLISACTVGPDYQRSDSLLSILGLRTEVTERTNAPATFQAEAETADEQLTDISQWWTRLGDPELALLVAEMLRQNKDLEASAARVAQAQARLENVTGNRLPSLDVNPSASRSFTTNASGDRTYANSFSAGASLSWQVDLFGRLRRSQRAEAATLAATRADWQGLVHTQIATLVRTRIALATLQRRLDAIRAIAESRQSTLEAVERRYRAGLESTNAVDIHSARENLRAALADIPSLENDLASTSTALDILLGRIPGQTAGAIGNLGILPPPRDVPLILPAALLDRRPDIQAAEFRLIAATENVGVAIADLYPNLSLTGSLSTTAATTGNLFDVTSLAGSLVAGIAQPIFDGGSRQATVRQRKAAVDEQAATYAGVILNAFKEVEDALTAERKSGERLSQLEIQVNEVRLAEASAFDRFRRGIGRYETLLETQRRLQNAEQTLLIEQQNKWNTRLDLLLALGGDWLETTSNANLAETRAPQLAMQEGKPEQ